MLFGAIRQTLNRSIVNKLFDHSRKISQLSFSCSRSFHGDKCMRSNYEGDGKTTVAILNRDHKDLVMIDSISNFGFRLNNGIFAVGPIAVFPRTILQWNVSTIHDVNDKTLSLFYLLEPKIDILILGTGQKRENPSPEVLRLLRQKNICVEILTTEHACATFNFLNVERRYVAAALIPPEQMFMSYEELELIGENERLETFSLSLGHTSKPQIPDK